MIAMPFHCEQCGKEWWWEFGPQGTDGEDSTPPELRLRWIVYHGSSSTLPSLPLP